jgi:hypothetical protein
LTTTLQEAPAASVAPNKLTEDEPLAAVAAPPQVLLNPLGVATISPRGRLSVKAIPVNLRTMLGLVIVNDNVVVALSAMLAAPKDFTMPGGSALGVAMPKGLLPTGMVAVTVFVATAMADTVFAPELAV